MIRHAALSDIGNIIAALREFHQESSFREVAVDDAAATKFLEHSINSSGMGCIVSEESGVVQAVFIGYISTFFFSTELGAWSVIFYVSPRHRNSVLSRHLYEAAVAWARSNKAKKLFIGVSTSIHIERSRRFFERMGMAVEGHNFSANL